MKRLEKKILDNMVIMKEDGEVVKAFQGFVYPGGSGGDDGMDGFGIWLFLQMIKDALVTMSSISEQLSNPEELKKNVCYILVNKESWLVKDAPVREISDMRLIYLAIVGSSFDNPMAMRITNEVAKEMGLTEEQLYSLAKVNTPQKFPLQQLQGAGYTEGLNEIFEGKVQFRDVRTVTNSLHVNGAAAVLYENVLKEISDEDLSNEIVIIPTSVHEMLVCSAEKEMLNEKENLVAMLKKLNSMNPDERFLLSENVYAYDREKDEIYII